MLKGDHLFFGNAAADGAGSRLFFDAAKDVYKRQV